MPRTQRDWALRGPAHHNWSDDPSYETIHCRVRRARGKASSQRCFFCGGLAKEWSYIHDSDPLDVMNYRPACKKCHHAYDRPMWDQGIKARDISGISAAATATNEKRWKSQEWRAKMSKAIAESNRRRARL